MNSSAFPAVLFNVPRHMEYGEMRFHPLRLHDVDLMRKVLREDDIIAPEGLTVLISKSRLSFWWWLKKTYVISYRIDVGPERKGFIGLYDLAHKSAEISLVIFDDGDRRLGYGTVAFNLLAQIVRRHIREIRARVKVDNRAAVAFWSKLGFREISASGGMKLMSVALTDGRN